MPICGSAGACLDLGHGASSQVGIAAPNLEGDLGESQSTLQQIAQDCLRELDLPFAYKSDGNPCRQPPEQYAALRQSESPRSPTLEVDRERACKSGEARDLSEASVAAPFFEGAPSVWCIQT